MYCKCTHTADFTQRNLNCIQATLVFRCMHSLETEPMFLVLLAPCLQFKLQKGFLKIIKWQNAKIIKHCVC